MGWRLQYFITICRLQAGNRIRKNKQMKKMVRKAEWTIYGSSFEMTRYKNLKIVWEIAMKNKKRMKVWKSENDFRAEIKNN